MRRCIGLAAFATIELLERRLHCSASPEPSALVADYHTPGIIPLIDHTASGTLATFRGPLPLDHYKVTLDWVDSRPTEEASLSYAADGSIVVSASHTYQEDIAWSNVNLTIEADGVAQKNDWVYLYPPLYVYRPGGWNFQAVHPISGRESDVKLGEFYGEPGVAASDFEICIDWGDGSSPSFGYASPIANGRENTFEVHGTHQYGTAGRYVINYTIESPDGAWSSVEPPEGGWPVSGVEVPVQVWADERGGNPSGSAEALWADDFDKVLASKDGTVSGVWAHFTGQILLDDSWYSEIAINWGDSYGGYPDLVWWPDGGADNQVSVVDDGNGGFYVVGSHTYGPDYAYPQYVTVQIGGRIDGAYLASSSMYAIPFNSGIQTIWQEYAWFEANQQAGTLEVSRFYDPDPAELSDYAATIDWGDGTITPGVITFGDGTDHTGDEGQDFTNWADSPGGDNTFHVRGQHRYSNSGGDFYPHVMLTKKGGEPIELAAKEMVIFGDAWPVIDDGGDGDGGEDPPPVVDPPVEEPTDPIDPPVVDVPVVNPPVEEPTGPIEPPVVDVSVVEEPADEPVAPASPLAIAARPPSTTSASTSNADVSLTFFKKDEQITGLDDPADDPLL